MPDRDAFSTPLDRDLAAIMRAVEDLAFYRTLNIPHDDLQRAVAFELVDRAQRLPEHDVPEHDVPEHDVPEYVDPRWPRVAVALVLLSCLLIALMVLDLVMG